MAEVFFIAGSRGIHLPLSLHLVQSFLMGLGLDVPRSGSRPRPCLASSRFDGNHAGWRLDM